MSLRFLIPSFTAAMACVSAAHADISTLKDDSEFKYGCSRADTFTGKVSISEEDGWTLLAHFTSGIKAESDQLTGNIEIFNYILGRVPDPANVRDIRKYGYAVCQKQEDLKALQVIRSLEAP